MVNLDNIKEDRDVVEPFVERLLQRLRERHPTLDITRDDISVFIEVRPQNPQPMDAARIAIRRMLREMEEDGVII